MPVGQGIAPDQDCRPGDLWREVWSGGDRMAQNCIPVQFGDLGVGDRLVGKDPKSGIDPIDWRVAQADLPTDSWAW